MIILLLHLWWFVFQSQGDPELEIKEEPEAWSVTVDKKVLITVIHCQFCFTVLLWSVCNYIRYSHTSASQYEL